MDFLNNNGSLAEVTAQGIIFREKKYTCPLAISEQWFSLNSPYYMVKVPVIYTEEHNTLCIILDTGDLIKAQLLSDTKNLLQTDLEEYYLKLNQLKLEKNKQKHLFLKRRK
ncbi:hypothetical protein GC102_15010 [Paenibacillus sp. LMG 31460]|uniref:Uncharacterized protein n=1 Tax=Paenibacillus germinis TaxID=2654979 RepID=A0ABX1Z498_9BACL|nr:hypothetical protein [Paenibacillus germinis]NOU87081.1 hypothetical protein [Paenibacillus germinis]